MTHDDPLRAFVAAIHAGDAGAVARQLKDHSVLKGHLDDSLPGFHFDGTALLAAVHAGNRTLIDLLLANGADINQKSRWWAGGFGVLDYAGDLAPYLIGRGAIVDAHAAARLGMLDRLAELVAGNREVVHARAGDGQTPLHVARSVEVATFLLDHGADIDALDVDHESTPAQYLVREHPDVVRYLIARGCRTDILMAAAVGDLALVRRYLDQNPDSVRTTVSRRYFPMKNARAGGTIYIWSLGKPKTAHVVAREFGHEDVVRLLMERSPDGLRLAQACMLGDEATCKALLAARPDIGAAISEEESASLAGAAENNNTSAVRLMLAAGWPVAARGEGAATALHWAAFHGNLEMVREILRHDPPLEAKESTYNGTPFGWAVHGSEQGHKKRTADYAGVVDALRAAGAKP